MPRRGTKVPPTKRARAESSWEELLLHDLRDPTRNVLELVEASARRQDDLRNLESSHIREVAELRSRYDGQLRVAESQRIDAIRAVDVGAVQQAASVSATQATTLAAQVATSAETLRTQVAAAATAATVSLAAALEPVQKDIADLRRAQYEAQGKTTQVADARSGLSTTAVMIGAAVALVGLAFTFITVLMAAAGLYLALRK